MSMSDPRGEPIEPRTPPSVRHPNGLPRCRRVRELPDGSLAQCKRAASWQLGSPVCGVHGGGWPVRVARGDRKNPVTSSLCHGNRSRYETILVANRDPSVDGSKAYHAWLLAEVGRIATNARNRTSVSIALEKAARGYQRRGRPTRAEAIERRKQWLDRRLEELFPMRRLSRSPPS